MRTSTAQDVDPQPLTTNLKPEQGDAETADEAATTASASHITGAAPTVADSAASVDQQFRMTSGSWMQQFMPQVARPLARAVDAARPQPTTKQAPKTPRAQAASSESAQAAPVAVLPTPTPELAATAAAGDSINNDDFDVAAKAHTGPDAPEPEEAASPTVTAADSQAQPQEMAFATRVQPVQSTEHSALPAEMASTAAVASASKKVVAAADAETAPSADPHAPVSTANTTIEAATSTQPNAEPATTSSHAAPATQSAEPPAAPEENLPKATTPLKDISLQVNQPGNERVDIRVVQQGSEVHVSVHSGDASLNSGLRQGLSELQSKLEETGYRSEMWRPGASSTPLAAAPSSQESSNHSRGGDGQPQQGGSQQESGRRNQNQSNQNQSSQPHWVEELKSSFGEEKSSGGFYGFSS
jgi:hypothetical protein